ncbi:MAG: hypothetical protein ACKO23_16990 [Gemmataceae bacterium]
MDHNLNRLRGRSLGRMGDHRMRNHSDMNRLGSDRTSGGTPIRSDRDHVSNRWMGHGDSMRMAMNKKDILRPWNTIRIHFLDENIFPSTMTHLRCLNCDGKITWPFHRFHPDQFPQ